MSAFVNPYREERIKAAALRLGNMAPRQMIERIVDLEGEIEFLREQHAVAEQRANARKVPGIGGSR